MIPVAQGSHPPHYTQFAIFELNLHGLPLSLANKYDPEGRSVSSEFRNDPFNKFE
jgi:hypothetical protein